MKKYFEVSSNCANEISKVFKKPIKLEFEKIMFPFLMYKKKRYAFVDWTDPLKSNKMDFKGLEVIRSDYCDYVRETLEETLSILMYDKDKDKSIKYLKNSIRDLFDGKIPMKKLILSKKLKGTYLVKGHEITWYNGLCKLHNFEKSPKSICSTCNNCLLKNRECTFCSTNFEEINSTHVKVAVDLLNKLGTINGPKQGDRIEFIFIKKASKTKMKQKELVVHPSMLNDHEIDYLYYFEHQLKKSINTIYSVFNINIDDIYNDILKENYAKGEKMKNGCDIKNFF